MVSKKFQFKIQLTFLVLCEIVADDIQFLVIIIFVADDIQISSYNFSKKISLPKNKTRHFM